MPRVSVHTFVLSPAKYLAHLPVVLTRYNLPIAIVNRYESVSWKMEGKIGGDPNNPFPLKKEVL